LKTCAAGYAKSFSAPCEAKPTCGVISIYSYADKCKYLYAYTNKYSQKCIRIPGLFVSPISIPNAIHVEVVVVLDVGSLWRPAYGNYSMGVTSHPDWDGNDDDDDDDDMTMTGMAIATTVSATEITHAKQFHKQRETNGEREKEKERTRLTIFF